MIGRIQKYRMPSGMDFWVDATKTGMLNAQHVPLLIKSLEGTRSVMARLVVLLHSLNTTSSGCRRQPNQCSGTRNHECVFDVPELGIWGILL
jgi:hypothetical protein